MNKNKVKPYIREALLLLLDQYELKDITIKMLVDKAGICRASFYRNYDDIQEVIKDIVRELFSSLYEHNVDDKHLKEFVYDIFTTIYNQQVVFNTLLKHDLDYIIHNEVYRVAMKTIQDLNVYNHIYQPYFFAGASSALLIAWAKHGYKEAPEIMQEIFFRTMKGYMEL